ALAFTTKAQEWSEPVTVFEGGTNYDPDFAIDSNGALHVVWTHKIAENNWKIYYSESTDQGSTWSEPYDVVRDLVENQMLRAPKIAVGSNNEIFITYDVHPYSQVIKVYMQIFNGNEWSNPMLVSRDMSSAYYSRLIVDNEGVLHIFWYNSILSMFQYRTFYNQAFSNISQPYNNQGTIFLSHVRIDKNSKIHCFGVHRSVGGSNSYTIYFTKYDQEWSRIDSVCDPYWSSKAMAINQNNEPCFLWVSRTNNIDTTRYTKLINNQWGTFTLTPKISSEQAIIVEKNGTEHIVQNEKYGSGYVQKHYILKDTNVYEYVIDESRYPSDNKLLISDSTMYLLYVRPLESNVYECDLYMKTFPVENLSGIAFHVQNNKQLVCKLFPNPTRQFFSLELISETTSLIDIYIYNVFGQLVYQTQFHQLQENKLFDFGKQPVGLYKMLIKSGELTTTQTFLIMR
ncbi:MAG: T9SS type A sorting domain-containing protein, partial [Bacteroidales bacterium]|nr:T9SS type A sorting domain-containing protein [Bacteroidales bacterium]